MTDLQALHDSTHTMVMGVLNITEDSSSDGGLWLDPVLGTAGYRMPCIRQAAVVSAAENGTDAYW